MSYHGAIITVPESLIKIHKNAFFFEKCVIKSDTFNVRIEKLNKFEESSFPLLAASLHSP